MIGTLYRILTGFRKGQLGQVTNRWSWGGVELQFDNGDIATYATFEIEFVKLPMLNYPPAGFNGCGWYDIPGVCTASDA